LNIQRKTGIPHSNIKQHFGTISRIVHEWASGVMNEEQQQTSLERVRVAQGIIRDPEFQHVGLIGDITEVRCYKSEDKAEREQEKSYKHSQKPARKYLTFIGLDDRIKFTSEGDYARPHDITIARQWATVATRKLQPQTLLINGVQKKEGIIMDTGFQGSHSTQKTTKWWRTYCRSKRLQQSCASNSWPC